MRELLADNMKTKCFLYGMVCMAAVGALLTSANAQTRQTPSVVVRIRTRTLECKVQAINTQTGALTVLADKVQEVITCGPDCRYGDEEDGLESLGELRVGEQIYIKCAEYDGRWMATRVARMKPQKAKAKPKSKVPPPTKSK